MKPSDILLMLKEAAGTAMYEDKKAKAFKVFHEKEAKLREIDNIFNTVINVSLAKLRDQKSEYSTYVDAENKKNKLCKYCIAYDYMQLNEKLKIENERFDFVQDKLEEVQNKHREILNENEFINVEKEKIMSQIVNTEKKEIFGLKSKLDEIKKHMTNEASKLEYKNENLVQEEKEKENIQKDTKELSDESFVSAIERSEQALTEMKEDQENLEENVKRKENEFKISKVANNEEKVKILRNKLEENLSNQKNTKVSITEIEGKLKESKEQKRENEQKHNIEKAKSESIEKELEEIKREIEKIKEKINQYKIDDNKCDKLEEEKNEKIEIYDKIKGEYEKNKKKIEELRIEYRDPIEHFDRNRIKGIVADLIRIRDDEYILPLDIAAGGKLRQLVIDTHETGKLLFKNKVFRKTVTLIPLDVVRGPIILTEYKKRLAMNLVGNKAIPALDLIEYDIQFKSAMEYVFGNTFICKVILYIT